jgi:D-alanine-D-alanine ligase
MNRGFVPVVHAAVPDRPDELDTLQAAGEVAGALARLGYACEVIDIGARFEPLRLLVARRPLAVFNMVEAVAGDAGDAYRPIELMRELGLPHTGAGAEAFRLTQSKMRVKTLLARRGIPTPAWWPDGAEVPPAATVIVKSDLEHASLGIDADSVVVGARAAAEIAARERRFGGRFFAESFVDGREFNVSMIAGDGAPWVLPIPEILFDGLPDDRPRIVDYEAKWAVASAAYEGTPRRFGLEGEEPELAAELCRLAGACWRAAALDGYARVDFRVDRAGRPTVLEINVNPCLARDAGFVATAAAAGLDYDQLIGRIVDAAAAETAPVA